MRAAFKKTGDMSLEVFDGEANDEKENSIIENCIANGYDGIIVQANNGEAQLPYIQQIVEADIPCITTNPRVECEGTGSVDADPYEQAKVNCELALKKIPKNAKSRSSSGTCRRLPQHKEKRSMEERILRQEI